MEQWQDLTVNDAEKVSDFYCKTMGWTKEALSMGDYNDYVMKDASGKVMGGICHARGSNNYLPPFWIIYIPVQDIDASLKACVENGGKVIGEKRKMGPSGIYCLVQDPAGAYAMITEGSFY